MAKHIKQADFARLCGVNRSTVNRWIKNGRIEADENGRIDPEAAQRMRVATESPEPHHQARKAQIEGDKAAQGAQPPGNNGATGAQQDDQPQGLEALGTALKRETLRLQKSKAEKAAMEVDRMAGSLLDRQEVEAIWAEAFTILRTLHENLPDRLAGAIAAHHGDTAAIHRTLEDAAAEILHEVSNTMHRKMEEVAA